MKRYMIVSAGPSIGGRGVTVKLRRTGIDPRMPISEIETKSVSYTEFKRMELRGEIETPAFVPREKRQSPSDKPYVL